MSITLVVLLLEICGELLSASVNIRCSEFPVSRHSTSNFAGQSHTLHPLRILKRVFPVVMNSSCRGKQNSGCLFTQSAEMLETLFRHQGQNGTNGLVHRREPRLFKILASASGPNVPPFFGLGFWAGSKLIS